jgi:hypothetical protein
MASYSRAICASLGNGIAADHTSWRDPGNTTGWTSASDVRWGDRVVSEHALRTDGVLAV